MLESLGWSETLSHAFAPYAARGLTPARIIAQHRGAYVVATAAGERTAHLAGRLLHDAPQGAHPVAGDWAAIAARNGENTATIHAVLPRRTAISRRMAGGHAAQILAANIDIVLVATSLNAELNPRRLERYFSTAWASGARPIAVLTKADLCADLHAAIARIETIAIGIPVIPVSAATGAGMAALAAHLKPGETAILLGASGVGKSTLVNALAGATLMATAAIREQDAKGRHTTTHRQLARLPAGALILDTPGMRELGLIDADAGLAQTFEDIETLIAACRFRNCGHTSEPGCAIRAALETGDLAAPRWKNFTKLQRELSRETRREDPLACAQAHKKWAALTKAQRAGRKIRGKP